MVNIKLSAAEEAMAKRVIKNIFAATTVLKIPQKNWADSIYADAGSSTAAAANKLGTEMVTRPCDFLRQDLDQAVQKLASITMYRPGNSRRVRLSADQIVKYIVWFCSTNNIIWDDTNITAIEQDEIKKTLLGGALYAANCFASTRNTAATVQANATTATKTTTRAPKTPGQAPAIGYKASGAHSQDIPNLIGAANMKVYISGEVYCVIADKKGKNTPNAYITPLKATSTGITQVSKAQAEKVNFGSGNGYTDCMCWFDNALDASAFAKECVAKFGMQFLNVRIVRDKAAANGYFRVSTEFGDTYIKASKLNEELEEALQEAVSQKEEPANLVKDFKITDIDLYDEWSHKSYS